MLSYLIYNFIIIIIFIIVLPVYIYKILSVDKYRETWKHRFGILPEIFPITADKKIIWFHAASAGEVNTVSKFINNSDVFRSDTELLLTTSTHSGFNLAHSKLGRKFKIFMIPFDIPWIIKPVVRKIKPDLTIIIDPNLSPNFIKYAAHYGNNVILLNAWFNNKIINKISTVPGLLTKVLNCFDKITLQSKGDITRFSDYIDTNKLQYTGNIKFGPSFTTKDRQKTNKLKKMLKLNSCDRLIIAGSTHYNEEEIILEVFKKLRLEYTNLVLLIAPRHIERTESIRDYCQQMGLNSVKKTDLEYQEERTEDIIILNTMGELSQLYSLSTITFMGGTLIDQGGHNILEAVARGNTVVFGPYYYNFNDLYELVLEKGIGFRIESPEELEERLIYLISDKKKLKEIEIRAKNFMENNKEAFNDNVAIINEFYRS